MPAANISASASTKQIPPDLNGRTDGSTGRMTMTAPAASTPIGAT